MAHDGGDDDHYPYADAVACALAAVLLLFVAAVVNQGVGEQTVPAYGTLAFTLRYSEPPPPTARPLALVELDGRVLAEVDLNRLVRPGPTFDGSDRANLQIGEAAEVRLESPEGAEPMISLQMARLGPSQTEWSVQVTVRDARAFGAVTCRLRFDAGSAAPVELNALYWDNQASESHPALAAKFVEFGSRPTTVEVVAGGDSLAIQKGVGP